MFYHGQLVKLNAAGALAFKPVPSSKQERYAKEGSEGVIIQMGKANVDFYHLIVPDYDPVMHALVLESEIEPAFEDDKEEVDAQ